MSGISFGWRSGSAPDVEERKATPSDFTNPFEAETSKNAKPNKKEGTILYLIIHFQHLYKSLKHRRIYQNIHQI